MRLMGFTFNKIEVERISNKAEKLKITSNIDISSINDIKSDVLKTKETLLAIDFKYSINYSPNFAKLNFLGNIVISVEPKQGKEILKKWENKQLPDDFKINLFNIILKKCNVKALELEEDIGLPLHVAMPRIEPKQNNN